MPPALNIASPISFANPLALLLLLLVIPVTVLIARAHPRFSAGARMPAVLARISLGLRLVIVTLMVLALAGPRIATRGSELSVVFLVDASDSVAPEVQAAARDWIATAVERKSSGDSVAIVSFGRGVAVERTLSAGDEPSATTRRPPGDRSDLGEGLRIASSLFPPGTARRVVLLSDGVDTLGNADELAPLLRASGVEVSTVALPSATAEREVLIESLDTPESAREGELVDLVATVWSAGETDATLDFYQDGSLVSRQQVHLKPGSNRYVGQQKAERVGYHWFRVVVTAADDTLPQNNELSSFTVVREPGRVLLVAEQPAEARELRRVLEAGGRVVDVRPPSALPIRISGLRGYDAVGLVNVPATDLTLEQMRTLQTFVKSTGKGVVVVGGDKSYGLGDYLATPLEEMLPVSVRPPSAEQKSTVALLLIIDKSGSMSMGRVNATKMAMAREAAILSVDALKERDQIGVLAFDDQNSWVVPLREIQGPQTIKQVQDLISRIEASGGTDIYNALETGYNALRTRSANVRHIILLTDGQSYTGGDYNKLIERMRADRVSLSTIAVGTDSDQELMKRLADWGKGRYYYTDAPQSIPRLMTRETKLVSGPALVQGDFQPRVSATTPILRGIAPADIPDLSGYVATILKPTAEVGLQSPRDDPVLAQWQYGLGRVVAFTSTASETWAANWVAWDGFNTFWDNAFRWAMPAPGHPNLRTTLTTRGDETVLNVEAVDDDGNWANLLDSEAAVVGESGPTGEPRVSALRLAQVAPGRYEARFATPPPGTYQVTVVQKRGGQPVYIDTAGLTVPYPREYRPATTNKNLLERLTSATGGQLLDAAAPETAFNHTTVLTSTRQSDLSWPLLALALLLLPLDIALRQLRPLWSWFEPRDTRQNAAAAAD